ncbi:PREDICTED: endonuclease domain-containing 1 protein-like [Cyprinodon variegatus]|uniref:endonuclease domain-containing 1 protein-like n=1 Tax=Cyprinodon variegatus TaxID=28743 RepID=UPI0007425E52|nr:PREDICTED: endonuclease domain-containing 1 protein-like [Cyprinodon variegatus]
MMFQQMWHFLPITALLFSLSDRTFAEVVQSISDCDHYLINHTPPHVPGILENGRILNQNRYKIICQTYRNRRRFVTLYDVQNKIPVFSAFRFVDQVDRKRPKTYWKIEPQLENESTNKNMMRENKMKNYTYQASNKDYKANNTFDRGHIFPSSYASSKEDKESTFTLTNIVPQAESFNKGSWNKMEMCTKCVMEKYCINSSGGTEGFVVTGAQPSLNSMLNRVNVPSALWSAFCCYSAVRGAWIASGHWGNNVQDESKHKYLETMTLENLQHILGMSNSEFVMFPGTKCPLTTTVTEFYPELKNCPCPPTVSGSITSPPSHFAFIFPLFVYSYLHWVSC